MAAARPAMLFKAISLSSAEIEVALQGVTSLASSPDHQVRVSLNGQVLGYVIFDGRQRSVERFSIPHSSLVEGQNTVTLGAQGGSGDISLVDYVRVNYHHTYRAEQNALWMTVAAGAQAQTVSGFTSPLIRVFDVTDPNSVTEIHGVIDAGETDYAITVGVQGAGTRTLLALTDDQIAHPVSITANQASSLGQTSNGADLIIITRSDLAPSLEPLKTLRQSQRLSVMVVDIEDVYDEFSFGNKRPQAVKDFLAYAKANWKKKPRFVLLAADGSFDPRNYLGAGDTDIVPAKLIDTVFMEAASDDWYVDFNDDGLPDIALGRLPVRTAEEAALMVRKIIGYESSSPSEEMLLVCDRNDGFNFEQASLDLKPLVPTNLRVNEVYRTRLDDATAKHNLLEAINRGQKIINYAGHGSVDVWRDDLLNLADAHDLTNGEHLSVFVMMNCLNGYYQDVAVDSLAESLMKSEKGGAVAVWASSTMTYPFEQSLMNRELYSHVLTGRLTLGEAVGRAKAATVDQDIRRSWILFGDPCICFLSRSRSEAV